MALEKAVEAVHSVERRKGDALDLSDEGARDIVRAVLLAVREPVTDPVQNAGVNAASEEFEGWVDEGQVSRVFTAMIDAILSEESK